MADEVNGQQAFETLGSFLKEDGWYPQRLDDKTIYKVGFGGQNGQFVCYAQVLVDLEQFLFYAVAPAKAPEEMRSAVAEFITRANYGLRIGNFEMDFNDGEVRCKGGLDFEGEVLTPAWIAHVAYAVVGTMDRYLGGLMAVIYGGQTAVEAIAEIEE